METMNVVCKEIIISNLTVRGKGTPLSPVRRVTEIFEKDGTLIAENDPCLELFTIKQVLEFTNKCIYDGKTEVTLSDLEKYKFPSPC